VRQLLSEPDAHDPVKPPDIYHSFDGPNPGLAGRTRWGNGFGAPQLDENGEYIDPDALVEKWKVRYYEYRNRRAKELYDDYEHGGRRYDEELGRYVSTDPRVNPQSGSNYWNSYNTYNRILRRYEERGVGISRDDYN
jgi:hypothetical protein